MKYVLLNHSKGGVGKTSISFALHEMLPNSVIWDTDPQKSSKLLSLSTNKGTTVVTEDPKSGYDYCIIDTPPYQMHVSKKHFDMAHKIIIPCKAGLPDVLAIKDTLSKVKEYGHIDKSIIVLNEVRQPINRMLFKVIDLLDEHYPEFVVADNFVSLRLNMQEIFSNNLEGKALDETTKLIEELCL